jgi:hypothetical protein
MKLKFDRVLDSHARFIKVNHVRTVHIGTFWRHFEENKCHKSDIIPSKDRAVLNKITALSMKLKY